MSLTKVNYIDNSTIITAKNLNDIQDNIIDLENDKISMELLWENENPQDDFNAQTINVNIQDYNFIGILVGYSSAGGKLHIFAKKMLDGSFANDYISYIYVASNKWYISSRRIYMGENNIRFEDTYRGDTTTIDSIYTHNSIIKPLKIYGIKGM